MGRGRKKKEAPEEAVETVETVQPEPIAEPEPLVEEKENAKDYETRNFHSPKLYGRFKGRYVAGLRKEQDKTCYEDIYSGDTLQQVKEQALEESVESGRAIIIFDRKTQEIVECFDPNAEE